MLIIKPIQDKETQKEVSKRCGFVFDPALFMYSEKEDENLIAGCQFDILGKESVICDFGMCTDAKEDIEALIILGRSVLNFLEMSGAENCTFDIKKESDKKYAKMIGFKEDNGKFSIVLKGLFDSKCSHCKS